MPHSWESLEEFAAAVTNGAQFAAMGGERFMSDETIKHTVFLPKKAKFTWMEIKYKGKLGWILTKRG